MEILEKINLLKEKYPSAEDQETLSSWEVSAKIAVITANLQANPAIKQIIEQFQKEVEQIDKELCTSEVLFMDEQGPELGRLLHARKKWCKKFLAIFDRAEQQVEIKNSIVENALAES